MQKNEFNFWQDHSTRYLEMAFSTDRIGTVARADGRGRKTGDCGDTVEMFLSIDKDRIKHVSFVVEGCRNTNACANAVACLAEEKNIEAAWEITPEAVIAFLETLPKENYHCAELAVGSFYLALSNYHENKRSSWKNLYR
jgi:nitrogen fixation protein NifU and related proteins